MEKFTMQCAIIVTTTFAESLSLLVIRRKDKLPQMDSNSTAYCHLFLLSCTWSTLLFHYLVTISPSSPTVHSTLVNISTLIVPACTNRICKMISSWFKSGDICQWCFMGLWTCSTLTDRSLWLFCVSKMHNLVKKCYFVLKNQSHYSGIRGQRVK